MDFSQMGAPGIIGGIIGLIIAVLIGGLVLSVVNRLINGFWPSYGRSVATVLVTGIIAGIINFIVLKLIGTQVPWLATAISLVVQIVIGGAIMNAFVRRPDGAPLGFKRAALVYLVLAILSLLFGMAMQHVVASLQGQLPAQ